MSKGNQIVKDAIAEAKVIRATALEQAKLALEEAFTPHLQSILAAKLNELEEEEEYSEKDDNMEETIDLEALLAEEEGETEEEENETETEEEEDEDKDISSMSPQEVEDYIRQIAAEEFEKLEAEQGESEEAPEEESDGEEEINLDELFNESEDQDEDDEYMKEEAIDENDINIDELLAEFGLSEDEDIKEDTKSEVEEELSQALATIDELRSTLHEVNLLNAKLLYMNKLFKSNNLTESQKITVVKTFDKTESVRETKLVYESLNSTLSKKINSKTSIKESLGFASKASGLITNVGNNNKVIDSDVQLDRWAKLAGLK